MASYHEQLKPLTSAELEGTHLFSANIRLIREGSTKYAALRPSSLLFSLLPDSQRGVYYHNFLSVGGLDIPD